jgi:O-antigen ligase
VAHNSYLQIWAESGTIAFGLFLFLLFGTLRAMRRLQAAVRGTADEWVRRYAMAIETTLYGYLVGAVFLNRAHFDLMYQLVAVGVMLPVAVVAERERVAALRRRRLGPAVAAEVWVRHRDPFVKLPSA